MNPNSEHFEAIKKHIPSDGIILEPGACNGDDTKILSELVPNGRYFAIEPDMRNYKAIVKRKFPLYVTVVHGALFNHTGTELFYPNDKNWTASGSCRKPTDKLFKNYPHLKFVNPIKVPCWTLDDFTKLHNIENISLLWCDVQGAERDIVEYGGETLKRTKLLNLEISECGGVYDGSWTIKEMYTALESWICLGQFGPDVLFLNEKLI